MLTNEQRADLALEAILGVDEAAGCGAEFWPAVTAIEDALTSIAHLCDRMGIPPAETFKDALTRYRQHLEGDFRAEQVADGLLTTLKEARDAKQVALATE